MTETLQHCPLCGQHEFDNYLKTKDYSITKENFTLQECRNCHFVFTNPRPDKANIARYYQSEEYISHSDQSNSLIDVIYKLVRNYTLKQKLKLINHYSNNGHLLDYGCGTGYFLELCQKHNWIIDGIEPDEHARSQAKKRTSIPIKTGIEQLEDNPYYDVITLWHVLEHVHDLNPTLDKLYKALKKDGHIIIAVPNLDALDAKRYKEYWAAYDVPRHLYHFTPDTIKKLGEKHQLKLIATKPMLFDAFYVSMLSEKYKGNTKNLINPFISGCKSNIYGKKTNNYSSLIYIFKK